MLDIRQPSLSQALAELVRKTGVELLYDERLVGGLRAAPVRGRLPADRALAALLAGSGIGYRRTPDGAFVLFALSAGADAAPSDGAISELLVIGRRTQNVDIRRTENDIQAYKVATRRDIETAHSDNIEMFLRSREPANVEIRAPSQDLNAGSGSTRSVINLRGFGPQRTLVLVDGRRMPNLPTGQGEFDQGDLNAIPLEAIERIETLTSTSGGIHGPGAIGGVVNVILRRDYRGADLNVVAGLSDRGDAGRVRLEGRIGFTPDHGRTDVMVVLAHAASDRLRVGQRDFAEAARARAYANDPAAYVSRALAGNAVSVYGGENLVLDPRFGGTPLGSTFTYLPVNFTGTTAERNAALVANSGKVVLSLPDDGSGTGRSLVANPTVTSGLVNVRSRLTDRIEVFVDGMYLRNVGRLDTGSLPTTFSIAADAPNNPFSQAILFRFPLPVGGGRLTVRTEVGRVTGGLIATLPRGWRASADYTIGRAVVDRSGDLRTVASPIPFTTILSGGPLPPGLAPADPLGDWPTFVAAAASYLGSQRLDVSQTSKLSDVSARLAGPIMRLPGGPLTLTVVAEARREHIPASEVSFAFPGGALNLVLSDRARQVRSGYAELRAPAAAMDAKAFFLRGLEFQIAARYDHAATTLPEDGAPLEPLNDKLTTVREDVAVYTAGARVFPLPALMLRASIATGRLPPNIGELQQASTTVTSAQDNVPDPRRGNQRIGVDGPYVRVTGGSHAAKAQKGRTVAVGAVIDLSEHAGPRLSVDYSRIVTRGDITTFPLSAAQLLAAEAAYPNRVVRAPLTEADRRAGYTAGRVIQVDLSAINAGSTIAEAVDVSLDWRLPPSRLGSFRLYGVATWQPTFRYRRTPDRQMLETVGYADGLLRWRGNMGVGWARGPWAADLNAQYFTSYRVARADRTDPASAQFIRFQGAQRFPSQTYVDLAVSRRFQVRGSAGPLSELEVRLGVQNLFDRRPPIDADPDNGRYYSPYGDPRRRRGELVIAARF